MTGPPDPAVEAKSSGVKSSSSMGNAAGPLEVSPSPRRGTAPVRLWMLPAALKGEE